MTRLLVFGRTGQVATEMRRLASPGFAIETVGRDRADLSDPAACAAVVARCDADMVLNAAAYTDVDRAESEEALATTINAEAPGAMARAAAERGLPFLHLSTDFVFDGEGPTPIPEDAPASPISAYGRSKLLGEERVLAAGGRPVVLRTSRVYAAHGRNFVRAILDAGRRRAELDVVDDQIGGPTSAADVAEAMAVIVRAFAAGWGVPGVFHFSGAPAIDLCSFARAIFEIGGGPRRPVVRAIASSQWPSPARRPRDVTLDCGRIASAYGVAQPDWRRSLRRVLAELGELTQ